MKQLVDFGLRRIYPEPKRCRDAESTRLVSDQPVSTEFNSGGIVSKAFYSFHFGRDVFRAALVRNIGAISGDEPISDNSWESLKRTGESAVERWIANQMRTCSVVIVLVGQETATRPWVRYEICHAWDNSFPIFGIRIHGLNSMSDLPSRPGPNPFENIALKNGRSLSSYVPLHNPAGATSKEIYASISNSMSAWIRNAPKKSDA